ncbi:tetratricopeptide repeat protein [Geomesophilobacter sediminis]|uniref:Tetratricopeptide repeat protein n=1 Tax=Geomesophilobacter sediminis TaxID=2798584 RepID=A0A8J7IZD2_9BACT|nr:hypothetical protein [Geomesophilobacter sediminis]MBJ6723433.1 hypothetical protein [Geomesophilobacter sediminis]
MRVLVTLLLLLTLGCSGKKVTIVDEGDALLGSGKYCEAYQKYRKAETETPDLSNDQQFGTNLYFAKKECVTASYRKGTELAAKKEYDAAIFQFKRALSLDRNHKKSLQALQSAFNQRAELLNRSVDSFKEAEEYAAKKQWRLAAASYQAALKINPDNEKAQKGLDECQAQAKRTQEFLDSAGRSLADKKWRAAIDDLKSALDNDPEDQEVQAKLAETQKILENAKALYQKGQAEIAAKKNRAGVKLLNDALALDPEQPEAREALVGYYARCGGELEEQGKLGGSVCYLKRALGLAPANEALKKRVASLEQGIRDRSVVTLAILPFKEYSRDNELSEKLQEVLKKRFTEDDQHLLRVVNNKPIEQLSQEKDIPMEKLVDPKDPAVFKGLKGPQAIVATKVASFKVSTEKKAESLTKSYQSGSVPKPNPEYQAAKEKLAAAEAADAATRQVAGQFGAFGSLLAKGVSGGTVAAMRSALANTPEYIDEPTFATWRYKVIHHIKHGTLGVSFRLFDTATGTLLGESTVNAEAELTGESVEHANPEIGIEEKPIPFESDDEIRGAIIGKGVDALFKGITQALSKYAVARFNNAEKLAAQGKHLEAAENYCDFIYSVSEADTDLAALLKRSREFVETVEFD